MKKGTFFVLSGPSGSGKGTVLKEVLRKSDRIVYSVSATSRSPRAGEVDGINYYFKSREEFETLIKADAFIEYTETYGNYYGTLKSEVEKAIENGKNIILEIDPVGARNVRAHYPDAVLMFLVAPDLEVLSSRLSGRGSENAETFKIDTTPRCPKWKTQRCTITSSSTTLSKGRRTISWRLSAPRI